MMLAHGGDSKDVEKNGEQQDRDMPKRGRKSRESLIEPRKSKYGVAGLWNLVSIVGASLLLALRSMRVVPNLVTNRETMQRLAHSSPGRVWKKVVQHSPLFRVAPMMWAWMRVVLTGFMVVMACKESLDAMTLTRLVERRGPQVLDELHSTYFARSERLGLHTKANVDYYTWTMLGVFGGIMAIHFYLMLWQVWRLLREISDYGFMERGWCYFRAARHNETSGEVLGLTRVNDEHVRPNDLVAFRRQAHLALKHWNQLRFLVLRRTLLFALKHWIYLLAMVNAALLLRMETTRVDARAFYRYFFGERCQGWQARNWGHAAGIWAEMPVTMMWRLLLAQLSIMGHQWVGLPLGMGHLTGTPLLRAWASEIRTVSAWFGALLVIVVMGYVVMAVWCLWDAQVGVWRQMRARTELAMTHAVWKHVADPRRRRVPVGAKTKKKTKTKAPPPRVHAQRTTDDWVSLYLKHTVGMNLDDVKKLRKEHN